MSNHDEFESLIKNFKLDDLPDLNEAPADQAPQRRAFDYDADKDRRPVHAAVKQAPPAGQRSVRAAGSAAPVWM